MDLSKRGRGRTGRKDKVTLPGERLPSNSIDYHYPQHCKYVANVISEVKSVDVCYTCNGLCPLQDSKTQMAQRGLVERRTQEFELK